MRYGWVLAVLAALACGGFAAAQSPGVFYTWSGTGDTRNWTATNGVPLAVMSNNIAGQLTAVETDYVDPDFPNDPPVPSGGQIFVADSFNRIRESSFANGGLDLTGLTTIEMDVSHNGTGPVNVQPYVQAGPNSTYVNENVPDVSMLPNQVYTLHLPLSLLTAEQRTYIRTIGIQARDHLATAGKVTWTLSEVRSLGTPLTERILASHDVGSSDNGLNGAWVNFGRTAIVGNDDNQNQTGLSFNSSGPGSLEWTDKGGTGTDESPSGGAVSWDNGTAWNGNDYFERGLDISNYNRVTYRISATDVTPGGGGNVGINGFFQTGNYDFHRVAGTLQLPVDGQFHDLIYDLSGISATERQIIMTFGLDLNTHPNNVRLNVDSVKYSLAAGVQGDYNNDGIVDAGDYVVWRDTNGTNTTLPNDATPGFVTQDDYLVWRAHFGKTPASGSVVLNSVVPEPSTAVFLGALSVGGLFVRRRGV